MCQVGLFPRSYNSHSWAMHGSFGAPAAGTGSWDLFMDSAGLFYGQRGAPLAHLQPIPAEIQLLERRQVTQLLRQHQHIIVAHRYVRYVCVLGQVDRHPVELILV